MEWDVEFENEEVAYRIKVGNLTKRQGLALDVAIIELTDRYEYDESGNIPRDKAYEMLHISRFPLLKYATRICEKKEAESEWKSIHFTEDVFWDLPETLVEEWYDATIKHNPHRDYSIEQLLKYLRGSEHLTSSSS